MQRPLPQSAVFPQLDGLRGIGAMTFFSFHFLSSLPANDIPVSAGVTRVSTYITVLFLHVFFAVSGFILFGSLERISDEAGGRGPRVMLGFYVRRFARIVPLWWLVLSIELFRQHLSPGVYLANATFLFGLLYFDPRYLPIGVAWTLFVEETFYALVPGVFRWIRGALSGLAFFGLMLLLARLWRHHAEALGVPSDNRFVQDFPFNYFKYFAIGILVRFLYPKLSPRWSPWLDAAAAASVVATALALRFATPAVFLLLLAVLVPGSRLGRWVTAKPLTFVGVHCYFIYLTHDQLFIEPVLDRVLRMLPRSPLAPAGDTLATLAAFALSATLCLAAAYVSMKLFEAPLMMLGKRLSSRVLRAGRPARPVPAAVGPDRAA